MTKRYVTLGIGLDDAPSMRTVRDLVDSYVQQFGRIEKTRLDLELPDGEPSLKVLTSLRPEIELPAGQLFYSLSRQLSQECIVVRWPSGYTTLLGPRSVEWTYDPTKFLGFAEHPESDSQRQLEGTLTFRTSSSTVAYAGPQYTDIGRDHADAEKRGDLDKAQAAAVAGGIQEHSVGSLYPLAIVGRGGGDAGFHWEVHNLQDGTEAGFLNGLRRQWRSAKPAIEFAERLKRNGLPYDATGNLIVWHKS